MAKDKRGSNKQVVATGRWLRLVNDHGWEYVQRVNASGVVAVVAVTDDDELIVTEQLRRAVGGMVIDLPAGLAGDAKDVRDEKPAAAARRELIEETGYDARRFAPLGSAPTSPGLTSEVVSFFRATGLSKVGEGGGVEGEAITVHRIKRSRADPWLRRKVRSGVHIDCKVYAGLYFACCTGSKAGARRR